MGAEELIWVPEPGRTSAPPLPLPSQELRLSQELPSALRRICNDPTHNSVPADPHRPQGTAAAGMAVESFTC